MPVIWISGTLFLSALFALSAAPKAEAQSVTSVDTQYTLILQNVFDFIHRHYVDEVDPELLYEGAMRGMFDALGDPYSSFLSEAEMSDLSDTTQGSFGGVGLYITKPTETASDGTPPYVEVASPIEDTPGWRAGINPGDLIIAIDGESTADLTMDEVLARLRGVPGTVVQLQIKRGEILEFPVSLTRAIIEVPTVKSAMIGNDVAYLRITTFTPMTVERLADALSEFSKSGFSKLIIDLRNNYGGLLNAAVGTADFFLDGGVVVSTKSRIPDENAVFTAKAGSSVPSSMPIVVLINRGSASASEIVAGALKDRGRAYLIGEKSFGKGSVQQVYPIGSTGFKITTSRYYTPSDVNIDKTGIAPDLEVSFPVLSDAEAEALNGLIAEGLIPSFVKENPAPSVARFEEFAKKLAEKYKLDLLLLRRMIRDELNRTVIAPVYDLEYDIQLAAAVKLLRDGSYSTAMASAKTLKEIMADAETAAETDPLDAEASSLLVEPLPEPAR